MGGGITETHCLHIRGIRVLCGYAPSEVERGFLEVLNPAALSGITQLN
jgi:hypothetical protein